MRGATKHEGSQRKLQETRKGIRKGEQKLDKFFVHVYVYLVEILLIVSQKQ